MTTDASALHTVTEQDRDRLLQHGNVRSFPRRQTIFHAGDPGGALYLVRSGHVAIRIVTEHGDAVTLTILGPGETFGELSLIGDEQRRSATATALESTETVVLTRSDLLTARRAGLPVDAFLLQLAVAQVHRLTRQVIEALYVPVRHRVVRRLLDLCPLYAQQDASINLLVTQDDLAGLAGAGRPSVNQVLQTLEEAGAIRLHRGRIEIRDQDQLRRRSG